MRPTLRLFRLLLFSAIHLFTSPIFSQEGSVLDISKINLVRNISPDISSQYISKSTEWSQIDPGKGFQPGVIHKSTIPNKFVTRDLVIRFRISNTADSAVSICFFPGLYYEEIGLFKAEEGKLAPLPRVLPTIKDSSGYRILQLGAHDTMTVLARLHFVKTYINSIRPRLINVAYLPSFVNSLGSNHLENDLMTYIFCGLLLMMILYSLANFVQGANKEFLYYSLYAFFLSSMLFTKALFNYRANPVTYFFEGYLDFIMQGLGIMCYMIFMQRFLETRQKHRFLYSFYNIGIGLMIVSMLSYTWFHYFTDNFVAENGIENITKVLLLIMVVIFLVYSIRNWQDRLMRYLFWGNLCLFVFSLISQLFILNPDLRTLPGLLGSALFYYELGLLLELVFFLAGLNQKNRRTIIEQTRERETLKAQNKLQEYEKEIAVYKAQQEERSRISADMHDELGSGMTAIRLMSEIARNKMKENTPAEIDKISASADDVLNKMNAIIWSMNSGNDTLDNLVSYIRAYSIEYFENTPIECKVVTPEKIEPVEISGDKRRNIFLAVKETLHNALKHSGASEITLTISTEPYLLIKIADNGRGIDTNNLRQFGNGLKNIKRRMESIGGTFRIEKDGGTVTTLQLAH